MEQKRIRGVFSADGAIILQAEGNSKIVAATLHSTLRKIRIIQKYLLV